MDFNLNRILKFFSKVYHRIEMCVLLDSFEDWHVYLEIWYYSFLAAILTISQSHLPKNAPKWITNFT